MDSFSNDFTSSKSSVTNPSINGGNNENEPNPEMASKLKKQQLPTNKILGERNETLDIVKQPTCFDSRSVIAPVDGGDNAVQKPYDPVNNYLSPRPKFLRYNPNRRRNILVLQENEESVRSCSSFDAGLPSPEMDLGVDSSGFADSCSQKESVNIINNQGECEEDESQEEEEEDEEEEEEEEIEFVEHRFWNLKDLLKFLVVVIALIYTTQAICSMNSPTPSHTPQIWSDFHGVAGLNFSEVGSCSLMQTSFVMGSFTDDGDYEDEVVTEEDSSDSLEESFTDDGVYEDDVENYEADAIDDHTLLTDFDENEEIIEEMEEILEAVVDESEEIIEAMEEILEVVLDENEEIVEEMEEILETVVDENEEIIEEMEEIVEAVLNENEEIAEKMEEISDAEGEREVVSEEMEEDTNNIKLESLDLNLVGVIGLLMLIVGVIGLFMYSKRMKSSSPVTPTVAGAKQEAKKEEIRVSEPSANSSSLIEEKAEEKEEALMNSASEQFRAPSVELLGEYVFVESNQATIFSGETKSSHIENSSIGGDSVAYTEKTIKKQRRKNVEAMITPSPVRRSSRLQNRSTIIKSP